MRSEDGKSVKSVSVVEGKRRLRLNAATAEPLRFFPTASRIFHGSPFDFPPSGQPATHSPAAGHHLPPLSVPLPLPASRLWYRRPVVVPRRAPTR